LVGVYLVFASLIVPALAVAKFQTKPALMLAGSIGVMGYFSGLIASAVFDLPSGAVIVWCLVISAMLVSVVLPGLLKTNNMKN